MDTHDHSHAKRFSNFLRYEPVIVDSTAIMTFKTCPRKYFYRIVLGFTPKVIQPYFRFGSAYHKFREKLEEHYAAGRIAGECFALAQAEALATFDKEGGDPPKDDKWAHLNKARLTASFMVAMKHWLNEKQQGVIKVLAWEQPFILVLPDGTKRAGRADQIIEWRGVMWGRDFKTTNKSLTPFYERGLEPNEQFMGYTWAENKLHGGDAAQGNMIVKGQVVELLVNDKNKAPEISTFRTERLAHQVAEWERDHKFWTDCMAWCRENDAYPMNEKNCSFCEYHSVCKQPSDSAIMGQLKTAYVCKPWDCTKVNQGEVE